MVYSRRDMRRAIPSLSTFLANNLFSFIMTCLFKDDSILCIFLRCGFRLSDLIEGLTRHSDRATF